MNSGADATLDDRGNTSDPGTRQEYDILTSTFYLGRMETTSEEREAREQEDLSTGSLRILTGPDQLYKQQEAAGQPGSV